MKRQALLFAVCAVAVVSCSPKAEQKTAVAYDVSTPMEEVMEHVIDPAAKQFWAHSGVVIDEKGEHSLVPTTDEAWNDAENGAMTVIQAANLLLIPERRRDEEDWINYTMAYHGAAREAFKATQKAREEWTRTGTANGDEMFETGAALYQTCLTCHEKYVQPYLGADGRPSKLGPDGKPNPLLKDNPPEAK